METEQKIRQAAKEALQELGIDNATLSDVVQHTMSHDFDLNQYSVQFKERGGKYFRVIVNVIEVHKEYGDNSVESFTDNIIHLLRQRNPDDYMPS